jgi:tetratricopeptide (TPR) repeat protein
LVPSLRALQTALSQQELSQAFRLAATLIPTLRQEAPRHVPRLAGCFQWAIIQHGQPSDLPRFQRLFGTHPEDPHLARLEALALENRGDLHEAHKYWQKFEQSVADHPEAWPAGHAGQVRALVWCHMGTNALEMGIEEKTSRGKGPSPSAEDCFRQALELAPDQREPREALLHYYQVKDKPEKAVAIGQQLLERFPDHAPTLETLGRLFLDIGRYAEGLDMARRALRANPLDRNLRALVSRAHTFNARAHGEAGRFEEARAEFQAALAAWEGKDRFVPLCKWAACEFKAENTGRAEELLVEARSEAGRSVAIGFLMAMEAIRFKLPKALKTRFEDQFKAALAEAATAEEAAAGLTVAASHRAGKISYRGQKGHEKKLIEYLGRVPKNSFNEEQLEKTGASLLALKEITAARKYAAAGTKRFRNNPFFPFMEAQTYVLGTKRRTSPWQVGRLLSDAEERANKLPTDERARRLLDGIRAMREELGIMDSPFGMLSNLFGGMFDKADEFDDGW